MATEKWWLFLGFLFFFFYIQYGVLAYWVMPLSFKVDLLSSVISFYKGSHNIPRGKSPRWFQIQLPRKTNYHDSQHVLMDDALLFWSLFMKWEPAFNIDAVNKSKCNLIIWHAVVKHSFSYEASESHALNTMIQFQFQLNYFLFPETWAQLYAPSLNYSYNWYFTRQQFTDQYCLTSHEISPNLYDVRTWAFMKYYHGYYISQWSNSHKTIK